MNFLQYSTFFGISVSLVAYFFGLQLKKRFKSALVNPLLISIVVVIALLSIFKIPFAVYDHAARYISFFLTPATICLAIPLYEKYETLRNNALAILAGILSGVISSMFNILVMAFVFGFSHREYVTFLPKSITTAIGMGISEEVGGYIPITVIAIIITGVVGNVMAEGFLKVMHITDPIAKGVAIGTSSHAIGTSKAMEMGEVEGALSSLSIIVSGLLTVIAAPLFAQLVLH
ncbi:MAG: LrgB family protein [Sphaerochaetaceae bacterium]|nr:LrgB family protein [Sphaerochaetaceae bacterium]